MTTFLNKILEKYKLQENLEWQVDENKESLISQLKNLTNENYYSGIFAILDLTAPKEKKFIGTVTDKGFVIRKRIKPFDFLPIMAKVKAEFISDKGKTKLIAKVNGMRTFMLVIRLLILLFLSLLALLVVLEALIPPIGEINPFPDLLILLFIASIFVLIPYLLGRRNVENMKTELNGIIK